MEYSNLEIYKELKRIKECHDNKLSDGDLDKIGKCIYENKKSTGLLNYLIENKYINNNKCSNNREIPFLAPYGNDFLNRKWINYFLKDYSYIINIIIGILITISTGVIIYIITS